MIRKVTYPEDVIRLLDKKACDMKCELNNYGARGIQNSYVAELATNYNFLCELIREINEKIEN